MDSTELLYTILQAYMRHTHGAKDPKHALRYLDGKTPFAIHPIWCGMSILMEPDLSEDIRYDGALALIQHDLDEDTLLGRLTGNRPRVTEWIGHMTFSSSEEENRLIWDKPTVIRLLKLYDKVNTLLDAAWMPRGQLSWHCRYVLRLARDVEANYGALNIVVAAKNLAPHRLRNGFKTAQTAVNREPRPLAKE